MDGSKGLCGVFWPSNQFQVLVAEAWFMLTANANAKRILMSHGCFRSECFTGVQLL